MSVKNVLILGSGGRESAIGWKIKKDNEDVNLFFMPGNGATMWFGTNIDGDILSTESVFNAVKNYDIDFVIIGPEQPLYAGISDFLREKDIVVFGPSQFAAQIETSKVFAKEFMKKYNIPTADFVIANTPDEAKEIIKKKIFPIVIKADGLAAGKGVIIAHDYEEAEEAIINIMVKKVFKESGNRVLIEDFLEGKELSVFTITDGEKYIILPFARDYKRIYDGNEGPNTGGMGSYAPVAEYGENVKSKIIKQIIKPVIDGMKKEGHPYQGLLYSGLMIDKNGNPFVIEFNARFGDPETQSVLPLVEENILPILFNASCGAIENNRIMDTDKCAVSVILASHGYPAKYPTGIKINGLEKRMELEKDNVIVFPAGIKKEEDSYYTSGGRVLAITAIDSSLINAREKVYKFLPSIKFDNMFFRKDIALEDS